MEQHSINMQTFGQSRGEATLEEIRNRTHIRTGGSYMPVHANVHTSTHTCVPCWNIKQNYHIIQKSSINVGWLKTNAKKTAVLVLVLGEELVVFYENTIFNCCFQRSGDLQITQKGETVKRKRHRKRTHLQLVSGLPGDSSQCRTALLQQTLPISGSMTLSCCFVSRAGPGRLIAPRIRFTLSSE